MLLCQIYLKRLHFVHSTANDFSQDILDFSTFRVFRVFRGQFEAVYWGKSVENGGEFANFLGWHFVAELVVIPRLADPMLESRFKFPSNFKIVKES